MALFLSGTQGDPRSILYLKPDQWHKPVLPQYMTPDCQAEPSDWSEVNKCNAVAIFMVRYSTNLHFRPFTERSSSALAKLHPAVLEENQ